MRHAHITSVGIRTSKLYKMDPKLSGYNARQTDYHAHT